MDLYEIPTKEEIKRTRLMADMTQVKASQVCMLAPTSWSRYEQGVNEMPAYIWKLFNMVLAEKEWKAKIAELEEKIQELKGSSKFAFERKAELAEQERLEAEEKERKYQAMLEKAYQQEMQRREEFRPTLEYWKDIVRVKIKNIDEITKAKTEDYQGMVEVARQLEKFYHDNKAEIDARIEGTWVEPEMNTDWLDID